MLRLNKINLPSTLALPRGMWTLLGLLLPALMAAITLYATTRSGMGYSPDSVSYQTLAEGIAQGKGFTDVRRYDSPAVAAYPPGYSAALASISLITPDFQSAARWLHILLVSANVMLTGILIFRINNSIVLAFTGALLFTAVQDPYLVGRMVWSETVFTSAVLASLVLLERYIRLQTWSSLIALSLCVAFAAGTRMPALAAIAACGISILAYTSGSTFKKLIRASAFGTMSIAPMMLWMMRNQIVWGSSYVDRGPGLRAFNEQNFQRAADVVAGWFGDPLGIYLLIVILLGAVFEANTRKINVAIVISCALMIVIYFLVSLSAVAAFGLNKPFDERLFYPVLGIAIALTTSVCAAVGARWVTGSALDRFNLPTSPICRIRVLAVAISAMGLASVLLFDTANSWIVIAVGASVFAASYSNYLLNSVRPNVVRSLVFGAAPIVGLLASTALANLTYSEPNPDGQQVRAVPEIIEHYRQIETTLPVYANYDGRAYLWHGRPVLRLPQLFHITQTGVPAAEYNELLDRFRGEIREGAYVLYILPNHRQYLPSPDMLERLVTTEVVARTNDGVIYRVLRPIPSAEITPP